MIRVDIHKDDPLLGHVLNFIRFRKHCYGAVNASRPTATGGMLLRPIRAGKDGYRRDGVRPSQL